MKRMIYKNAAIVLACLTAGLMPAHVLAKEANPLPKEEVVYVTLQSDGGVGSMYVVNAFDLDTPGQIVDYGAYSAVANLSTTDPLAFADGKVSVDAPAGRFYYQGDLTSANLPWRFTITYLLNAKPVAARDLAGTEGHLEIRLGIRDNPEADKTFTENYALQIALTLDMDLCSAIEAKGATIGNSGKDKVLSFIKMPGTEADYSISADVTGFEMEGIQINGIPLTVDMALPDTGDLTGGISELQNGVRDLNSGARDLGQGMSGLKDGAEQLKGGLKEMQDGMAGLKDGFYQLIGGNAGMQEGSRRILDALNTIQEELEGFSVTTADLTQLAEGSSAIYGGIGQLAKGLGTLQGSFAQTDAGVSALTGGAYSGLRQANEATIVSLNQQIAALQADPAGNAAQIEQLTLIVGLLSANNELVNGLRTGIDGDGTAGNPGLAAGAAGLEEQYAQFDASIQALPAMLREMGEGITQLREGIVELAANYASFHTGVVGYTEGAAGIYAGYVQLCDGFDGLVEGGENLSAGAHALYDGATRLSDGTGEMESRTASMDTDMEDEIDAMIESYTMKDFDAVSFVSSRNTNIESVQFVMMTDAIEKAERENSVEVQDTSRQEGFWDRLLALFGI